MHLVALQQGCFRRIPRKGTLRLWQEVQDEGNRQHAAPVVRTERPEGSARPDWGGGDPRFPSASPARVGGTSAADGPAVASGYPARWGGIHPPPRPRTGGRRPASPRAAGGGGI